MLIEPEVNGASIVVLGHLNPAIFTPAWFSRYGLITNEQADAAELALIHPQVAQFNAAGLSFFVDTDKFQIMTTEAPFIRLSDMVLRIFTELLPHTPVGKLGINREAHFNVGHDSRNAIGEQLAPLTVWGDWGAQLTANKAKRGGMRILTMEDQNLADRERGYIRVTIQPSLRIKDEAGIFLQVNDHYELTNPEGATGATDLMKTLEGNRFDVSMKRAESLMDIVLRLKDAK